MTDLLDLPIDIREKALARMGLTEAEYREQQKRREAAVAEAEAELPEPPTDDTVPEKFKDTPKGIVHDD
jgi:hypothetical protein